MSNIPISYPNDDMDYIGTVKFIGRLYKLITLTNPEVYWKYIEVENVKTVPYVRFKKVITWIPEVNNPILQKSDGKIIVFGISGGPTQPLGCKKDG